MLTRPFLASKRPFLRIPNQTRRLGPVGPLPAPADGARALPGDTGSVGFLGVEPNGEIQTPYFTPKSGLGVRLVVVWVSGWSVDVGTCLWEVRGGQIQRPWV